MKTYQCHKRVQAARITDVIFVQTAIGINCGFWELTLEDGSQVQETCQQFAKAKPGGYLVIYEDGYKSYSPKEAFEAGYTDIDAIVPEKVSQERIAALARSLNFKVQRFPDTTTTIALARLPSGFTVATGMSACVSPALFDEALGDQYAIEDAQNKAVDKLWELEGYLLSQRLVDQHYRFKHIAQVAHEVNRAYCRGIGDDSQPAWADAPGWQKGSALAGVKHIAENPSAGPEDSHNSWLAEKERDGWKYGPVKNPETKEHPCFVPYDQLPAEQRIKDYLFGAVVRTLLDLI